MILPKNASVKYSQKISTRELNFKGEENALDLEKG